jgi:acyl-coenzyme A synthetase/AMP-(fatty) acid ligase
MLRLCATGRADVLTLPTPVLGSLLALDRAAAALASVRTMRPGAAGMSHADCARWRARLPEGCEFAHGLGSTEATRIAEWIVPAGLGAEEPMLAVGSLSPGQEYALLGEDDAPVPDGAYGELVLRGRHIALGEWQAGKLVAGRMHPDPAKPGTRVFRTGDLLRFGADGMLRFVGRADRQVKINGVRVEPAEIEAVIRADAAVRDAAVVASAMGGLHAFVAAPDADADALREALIARLRAALPSALRPRRVTVLASLPRLPGGKVDMVALRRRAEQTEDRIG